jgi:elongation factor Ts
MSVAYKRPASPSSGAVASYIHAGGKIGVLVEVLCESDFVAQSDDFRALIHDLAMHIAASGPKFVRREDVTAEAIEHEKDSYRAQAAAMGKPPQVAEKIVEGKLSKFYEAVCLCEQPFIKDQTILVSQLIASHAAKLRENIVVRQFARFKVEDGHIGVTDKLDSRPEGEGEAGIACKKPKEPKPRAGFAAAELDAESE